MALQTLADIRLKVRRLTRSPSDAQLSDADIDNYVNTFLLYDFPSQLRLFPLRSTLTFYTQPNVDTYQTLLYGAARPATDPLFDFKNRIVAIHPPVYIAGVLSYFTQDRTKFYIGWPKTNTTSDTNLRGNNTTGPFTGFLSSKPVLQNNVAFSCVDNNGVAMTLTDVPTSNLLGNLYQVGSAVALGTINYVTGAYTLNFLSNTANGATIYSTTVPYQAGKPLSFLYFDDTIVLRPVPNKAYSVQMEVDLQPISLFYGTDLPKLDQWSQYIAYGAAKKVFEDRMDLDSVALIMNEFKEQEAMVLRTTLTQQTNERTQTIYTSGRNHTVYPFDVNGWPY